MKVSKILSSVVIASVLAAPMFAISGANAQTATTVPAPVTQTAPAKAPDANKATEMNKADTMGKSAATTTKDTAKHPVKHSSKHTPAKKHDVQKHMTNKVDPAKPASDGASAPAKVEKKS